MVERSRLTLRAIERKAGVSHNTFRRVLNGDATLTMHHLLLILRVLGQDWGQFFHRAFPEREAVARTAALAGQGEAVMATKLEQALAREAESSAGSGKASSR